MYEKAVIYKLCCLDPEIKECYVGSTCNLYLRKSQHKQVCNNPNDKNYNLKVYQFVRENGGWNNWQIVLLEQYPCNSKLEMLMRERYWFEILEATLNSRYPNRTQKEWEEANAEHIKKYKKEYRETNAEKIKKYKKQRVKCECGAEVTSSHLAEHRKSNKHLQKMTTTE